MFAIVVPVQEIANELQAAQDELEKAEPVILMRVAEKLIEILEADFANKSAGGTGGGGVKWDKTKEKSGQPIGVETGEMKRKLQALKQGAGVEVLYATTWARHFDKLRTLIPDPLPPNWLEQLDEIIQPLAEQIVRDVLEGR